MKFALITEGVSEHRIIKHVISKYFKDNDPEINQIQPKVINDKQETIGGWNEVLSYCERQELEDILIENDYLVIQIDTDQSQTAPFSVNHLKEGHTKTDEELHKDIQTKLTSLIKRNILQNYNNKILFAICIHTIECWLLPIYYTNNNKSAVINCLDKLNKELRRKDIHIIPVRDKNNAQSIRAYEAVLGNWSRKIEIASSAQHNVGFKKLIESFDMIPTQ